MNNKPYIIRNMKLSRLKQALGNVLGLDLTPLNREQFENYCWWMGLEIIDIIDDEKEEN